MPSWYVPPLVDIPNNYNTCIFKKNRKKVKILDLSWRSIIYKKNVSQDTFTYLYKIYTQFYGIFSINTDNYQTKVIWVSNLHTRFQIYEGVKQVIQTHILYSVVVFDMKNNFSWAFYQTYRLQHEIQVFNDQIMYKRFLNIIRFSQIPHTHIVIIIIIIIETVNII